MRGFYAILDATPELLALCQFNLNDRDNGVHLGWLAFGTEINVATSWGSCKYSCASVSP